MTTSEMSGAPEPAPRPRRRVPIGVGVLAVLALAFLAFSLPAYLGLDPAAPRVPIRPDYAWHYPLLWAHIAFGSVALVTACLQVWPWLRRHRPQVHRWSGRVYVFGGVLPGGVAVLGVAPVSTTGPVSATGNTVLALLWLGTTVAGWRAVRQRRHDEHRAWMIRSVALTFSIVLNRVWIVVYAILFSAYGVAEADLVPAVGAASVWTSWVVNLLVAEWWILRRRASHGREVGAPSSAGSTVP